VALARVELMDPVAVLAGDFQGLNRLAVQHERQRLRHLRARLGSDADLELQRRRRGDVHVEFGSDITFHRGVILPGPSSPNRCSPSHAPTDTSSTCGPMASAVPSVLRTAWSRIARKYRPTP